MKKLLLILLIFIASCSSAKEFVMPFRNYGYSAKSLLPIQNCETENIIRIWINNGTSIDRIITVSNDSVYGPISEYIEIGETKNRKQKFIIQKKKTPASGIIKFLKKIDSLELLTYTSQKNFESTALHQPFSMYIIEQKKKNEYNQFTFRTNFPNSNTENNEYTKLEEFIMNEFQWEFKWK